MYRHDIQDSRVGRGCGTGKASGKGCRGEAGLPDDELWEKTQLPLVPGSVNCLPLDLLPHAQWVMLAQEQGPVIGTGHLMAHYPDEVVKVPAVKGSAWPEPDIYSHSIVSCHIQDGYNHITRKKEPSRIRPRGSSGCQSPSKSLFARFSPALLNVLPAQVLNPQRSNRKSIHRHSGFQ